MKKDFGPFPAMFPMPVLIVAAYDETGTPNAMNAAWGTICDNDKIALILSEDHKTTKNIMQTKAFTVAFADRKNMKEADYFGIASGNTVPDKVERTGMTAVKSGFVNAPVLEAFPVCVHCELLEFVKAENLHAVVGKIVNVSAEEAVLDENGKIDAAKLDALVFDTFRAGYYSIGEEVGKAWNAGRTLME